MHSFFLLVELVFIFAFALYLVYAKKELAIIYLPVIFFARVLIVSSVSASAYYFTTTFIILLLISKNPFFYRNNLFSILLILYFLLLLPLSSDLVLIRPFLFSVLWLFALIPLIVSVYQKYSREILFKELVNAAFIILSLFIANTAISTFYKYSPNEMYGITSGLLYGNLWGASFNVLAIALFIILLKILEKRKLIYVLLFVVAFCFVVLTLRRSVILLSAFGLVIGFLSLVMQRKAKMILAFGSVAFILGYLVISNTEFLAEFNERVELRKLDERNLEEEQRFTEYRLLYEDMFVYHMYSPWFGFELFNSWGNYGRGVFDQRSLHGDLTSIAHSSGILGVFLYLSMAATAFRQALKAAAYHADKLVVLFCAVAFVMYTITGRYTQIDAMVFLFLVLLLPLSQSETQSEEIGYSG